MLWALALAGLALLAGFTAWFCIRALGYPYQLLYGEGFMLEFARRLAVGEALYKPLAEFPLGTVNYPPLSLLLARLLFPVTGLGYAAGRIWAMLAAAGVAAMLCAWVHRATQRAVPAVAAALAWLGAPYVYHWAPQFRADLPGLALSLAGVYVAWRGWDKRVMYAAAPLFVLGLYCKQSFVAAPGAVLLALLLSRRPGRALTLAGLTAGLGGLPFLALNHTTGGAFWESLVRANVNPFTLGRLSAQVAEFGRTFLPLLALSLVCLVRLLRDWREAPHGAEAGPGRLVFVYLLLALLSAGLAGKAGSWENYFLEPLAAACLGAGLGLAGLGSRKIGCWLAPLLILCQVALMWHTPAQANELMRADAAANRILQPRVAAEPGLMLSEDAGLLVQAGKPVPYYDFQLSQLARVGRWDQTWELSRLRRGEFPMVIFEYDSRIDVDHYGRYTRAFMSALDYGYRLSERVGKYRIYRPAPLGRERPVAFGQALALVGHTLPPAEAEPGQTLSLDLLWKATQPMTQTYTSFLHLVDAQGRGYAGDDRQAWGGLYPTTRWAPGEMVRMGYTLTLPLDLPPGLYRLQTGWYDASLTRLRTDDAGDRVSVAAVVVPDRGTLPEPMDVEFDVAFQNGVHLLGYALRREPGSVRLDLAWKADKPLPLDYTVFVHLRDAAGRIVAQGDGPPLGGAWPTSLWPVGYRLIDSHWLSVPADLTPGGYELVVGLYDPQTNQRALLQAGGDAFLLGSISVP